MYKGLIKGLRSGYDPDFVYNEKGWTVHPNPDTKSASTCGRGLHLSRRIIDIPQYVSPIAIVARCLYRGKIAGDDTKIRVKEVLLVERCPWKKLATLYKDYKEKRAPLDKDYEEKWATLYKDYKEKRAPLYKDYDEKRATLYKDYKEKGATLYKDYEEKWATLDKDYEEKRAPLDKDYEEKLRRKLWKEAKLV